MRPSNPPRNVALCKNLESVATAPQFLEASKRVREMEGGEPEAIGGHGRPTGVRQALRHDNDAERKFIQGVSQQLRWGWLCRIEWMTRLSFDVPAVISRWKQKNRTPVKEGLVDIRYVCAGCGMETKRPIADEGH